MSATRSVRVKSHTTNSPWMRFSSAGDDVSVMFWKAASMLAPLSAMMASARASLESKW